jgi:hypothetical protein
MNKQKDYISIIYLYYFDVIYLFIDLRINYLLTIIFSEGKKNYFHMMHLYSLLFWIGRGHDSFVSFRTPRITMILEICNRPQG